MIPLLAWRNIWRQPTRTVLSLTAMAFAAMLLVFMLSFQFGAYDGMKSSILRLVDGFGQFQPKGYKDDPKITKIIARPDRLVADLATLKAPVNASVRASAFVLLANGERTLAASLTGIDPVREAKVSRLPSLIKLGRALRAGDNRAIILGDALARDLHLKIGDPVTMLGSGLDGSMAADVLRLVGIFSTGVPEIDRQAAEMPLKRFRDTFVMGKAANVVAITGRSLASVIDEQGMLRAIARKNGVVYLDWGQLRPDIRQAIELDLSTSVMLYATLVIVVVFIILNTLFMSVLERSREFGVLLAVGMRPAQIGRMVWMEIILMSFVGIGGGIVLGMALTLYFQQHGIAFSGMDTILAQWGLPPRMYPHMTPLRVLAGPGAMITMIVLLGIIPYRHVLGLEPVSAMTA